MTAITNVISVGTAKTGFWVFQHSCCIPDSSGFLQRTQYLQNCKIGFCTLCVFHIKTRGSHLSFYMKCSSLQLSVIQVQYSFFCQVNWKLLKSSSASEPTVVKITPLPLFFLWFQPPLADREAIFKCFSLVFHASGEFRFYCQAFSNSVELSVGNFSISSICYSEMSCNEEKRNKGASAVVGCFLTGLHRLTQKSVS